MKKTLALLLAFVLVIGATMAGTIAYLQDKDSVKNTFTVGNVDITLDEAAVNPDGTYKTNHDNRVQENSYKLMPGHSYFKDPTVTVKAGSEEAYIRCLVTFNNIANLDEVFDDNAILDVFKGYDGDKWLWKGQEDNADGTRTYEFRYFETVAAPTADVVLVDLFTSVQVPGALTNDQLAKLAGTELTVVAQAIQADGFADADEAWDNF